MIKWLGPPKIVQFWRSKTGFLNFDFGTIFFIMYPYESYYFLWTINRIDIHDGLRSKINLHSKFQICSLRFPFRGWVQRGKSTQQNEGKNLDKNPLHPILKLADLHTNLFEIRFTIFMLGQNVDNWKELHFRLCRVF